MVDMTFRLTPHARARVAERGVDPEWLDAVLLGLSAFWRDSSDARSDKACSNVTESACFFA